MKRYQKAAGGGYYCAASAAINRKPAKSAYQRIKSEKSLKRRGGNIANQWRRARQRTAAARANGAESNQRGKKKKINQKKKNGINGMAAAAGENGVCEITRNGGAHRAQCVAKINGENHRICGVSSASYICRRHRNRSCWPAWRRLAESGGIKRNLISESAAIAYLWAAYGNQ